MPYLSKRILRRIPWNSYERNYSSRWNKKTKRAIDVNGDTLSASETYKLWNKEYKKWEKECNAKKSQAPLYQASFRKRRSSKRTSKRRSSKRRSSRRPRSLPSAALVVELQKKSSKRRSRRRTSKKSLSADHQEGFQAPLSSSNFKEGQEVL